MRSTCCLVAPMTVRHDPGAPRLTYALVAPALRGSRLASLCVSVWQRVDAAYAQSRSMGRLRQAAARVGATAPAALIAYGAWIVAIAAATNVMMLTTVERYHYPRRTALILPAILLVVALVAVALRSDLARAAGDKRDT